MYPERDDGWAGGTLIVDGREKGPLPGTVPVPPGRHHVLVRDDQGVVRVDGWLRLAGGRGYTVDEVARLAQGPAAAFGVRAAAVSSAALGRVIGPGAVGAEVYLADRANGEGARGFVTDVAVGSAVSPGAALARPVGWVSGGVGWQDDLDRLRLRIGVGLTAGWIPPRFDERPAGAVDAAEHPAEAGWWLVAAGPHASAGWVLGPGWTLMATARPHVAWLDTDYDGEARAAAFSVLSVGIEVDR